MRLWLPVLLAVSVVAPGSTRAFEIRPKRPVHEALTAEASLCMKASGSAQPRRCVSSLMGLEKGGAGKSELDLSKVGLGQIKIEELERSVTWPDDPTREVSVSGIAKFGAKMVQECGPYKNGIGGGLLCNSHYGTLQFFHGMASSSNEATSLTHEKIMAWTQFTYAVATGAIDTELDYCKQLRSSKTAISDALAPEGFFACTTPWRVGTLFRMTCKNPITSLKCTESINESGARKARLAAIGALLHVIQDSYAQGHARRGECDPAAAKGKPSTYDCLEISQFYSYAEQDSTLHALGDGPPIAGTNCVSADATVDDPILASATLLWFIANNTDPKTVSDYLRAHVFDLSKQPQPQAGPGACFKSAR